MPLSLAPARPLVGTAAVCMQRLGHAPTRSPGSPKKIPAMLTSVSQRGGRATVSVRQCWRSQSHGAQLPAPSHPEKGTFLGRAELWLLLYELPGLWLEVRPPHLGAGARPTG